MESQNSNQIKKIYEKYSNDNGFIYHESAPIVAPENSRLFFNISGGVIYQDELLGKKQAEEPKVSSIQKCIRTDNLDRIGLSERHHLLFEMIGHFMFHTCRELECKETFIKFAYDFLTKEVGLDKNRIYATIHPKDDITKKVWQTLNNNNLILSDKNTFTSPYADKSSLRTEILWKNKENKMIELWNLVFTQFNSKQVFENPSEFVAADSGASLERIVSAYEDKISNYDNSMWYEFIQDIKNTGKNVPDEKARRIADLTNTAVGLIDEGIKPGKKVQSYTLRKILRNLYEMCNENGINIEDILITCIRYNNLTITHEKVLEVILEEKKLYIENIKRSLKQVKKIMEKGAIGEKEIAYFQSTYGLPEKYVRELIKKSSKS